MRSYRKLMQIQLNHDYYTSGKVSSGDFKFFTTPATKKILENYRIVLKQNKNAIELIQECLKKDDTIEPLVEIETTLEFEFIIKQQNKQFFNYTETQYPDMRREIFFFSNQKQNSIEKSGVLSKNQKVGSDDLVLIKSLDKEKELKGIGAIGLIKLIANHTINETIQTKKPYSYTINFAPREAFWQYNIKKKYNNINKIDIIDENKKIKFLERKELATEEERVFISDKKMPIKQLNTHVFKLISANGKQNINKTMYEKLPYPKISNIEKHFKIKDELIVKAYIYI